MSATSNKITLTEVKYVEIGNKLLIAIPKIVNGRFSASDDYHLFRASPKMMVLKNDLGEIILRNSDMPTDLQARQSYSESKADPSRDVLLEEADFAFFDEKIILLLEGKGRDKITQLAKRSSTICLKLYLNERGEVAIGAKKTGGGGNKRGTGKQSAAAAGGSKRLPRSSV